MFPSQPPVGAGTAVNPAALILKFGRQIRPIEKPPRAS